MTVGGPKDDDHEFKQKKEDDLDYDKIASSGSPLAVGDRSSPLVTSSSEDPMDLLFSSGTTGPPQGIMCPVKALESFRVYLE